MGRSIKRGEKIEILFLFGKSDQNQKKKLRAVFFGRIKKQVRRPRFIKKGLRRRKKL
jgi:hypothetical protein